MIVQGFSISNRIHSIREEVMESTQVEMNAKITSTLEKYADMVRRICFIYLKNDSDVDDVFQEVFLALLKNKMTFENPEHEKAWLIKVTINKCKDLLKSYWYRNVGSLESTAELSFETKEENELIKVVLSIPKKYKDVIYLFYYEEYSVPEIARLLNQKENTIYSQLNRARKLIKEKLGGTDYEYTF